MTTIPLKDKVALVTGSARRVGKEIALALAREGAHIIVHHSNSDQDAVTAAEEIRNLGVRVQVVKADLRQPAEITAMFEMVREQFGRLDVLVNSAAIFKPASVGDIPLADWQEALDINVTAPFLCGQQAAQFFNSQAEGGTIVNILDMSAFHPWKGFPQNSVSKAALKMLTEVQALSFAPKIRVNAIALGPVLRDDGNSPERWEQIGQSLPLKHTGHPDDVAQAVIFLIAQPFITGTTLRIDGGEELL